MTLRERLNEEIKTAMKAREQERLGALRLMLAAVKQREVDERITLDDAAVVAVVEKMIKQRKDSISQYEKAARQDLADKEKFEISVIEAYLPQQLSQGEIDAIVAEAIAATGAKSAADMGKVMGVVKPKLAGRADMGKVSGLVKAKLSGDNPRMIPQDFIQSLLARVDIVDVIDRYVKLKKSGTNFSACCPFHTEKTPSFTVSPAKQFYHCFGCGAHGNAIGFLMEYSGQTYPDAIRTLAETVGMQVPESTSRFERPAVAGAGGLTERMMDALNYYRAELKKSRTAIDYLKGRGLSGEIAARYGLGYAPEGWQNLEKVFPDYASAVMKDTGLVIDSEPESGDKKSRRYDRFRDRVMFPILDARGNVIGFGGRVIGKGDPKYLNSPETPLFEKGRELYGLYQARRAIRDANQVIVVEGYMDVVALAQHGVENAVATLGTATTPFHVGKLLKLADNVVFCFDGDEAGRRAAWRALEVSLPVLADGKAVSFLFLPAEDDPDTFVRRMGTEAFQRAVAGAKPLSQFLFSELAGRTDMQSEESRARFLAQARPLIAQIQAPALAAMLRRRLAEMAGLGLDDIQELVPAKAPERRAAAPARAPKSQNPTTEARLTARILLHPALAREVPEQATRTLSADAGALRAVIGYFTGNPGATLGQASAYFAGSEHEPQIEAALDEPLLQGAQGEELDLEAEGKALIEKLVGDQQTRRRSELARLLDAGTATPEQRAEYDALYLDLASVKGGNPTPEVGSKL